jgi:hypothetical protein
VSDALARARAGRWPPRRRWDNRPLIGLVATASAVAAALTPAHPTGIGVWDTALKALFGAGVALAGAISSWSACMVAAAIVGAAGFRQPTLVPAGAVIGVGAAELWSKRSGPEPQIVRAGAAAVVAQLALRLAWPHQLWGPALVGGVAVLVVLLSASRRASSRARRRSAWVVAGCAVATIGLAGVAGASLALARSPFQEGIRVLKLGGRAAQTGDEATATRDFATAEQLFARAQGDLRFSAASEIVPVLAQQVRAVRVASDIAHQVAEVARATASNVQLRSLHFTHGDVPLAAVAHLGPVFQSDLHAIANALASTEALRSPWLVSPLHDRVDEIIPELQKAQLDAQTGVLTVKNLPEIVGAHGTRRYLVLFENPAEQRAGGGVVGNYAVLTATNGHLSRGAVGAVGHLDSTGARSSKHLIAPPGYLARYSQFAPEYYWQNVPLSPDFPTVGEVAAHLFPESGGQHVDGVISLDPAAIADILHITGPVAVAGWPQPISAANAVTVLAHGQFVRYPTDNHARQQFLKDLIKQTWHAFVNRPLPAVPQLMKDLVPSVVGRHLLIYNSHPTDEQLLSLIKVSGAMPAVHGDFLDVVTQNFGGNKLDWYLRRSVTYHAAVDRQTGQVSATMTLQLHNSSPTSGLPAVVIGPQPGVNLPPGTDQLWVSVYSPWEQAGATLNGKPVTMIAQPELGRWVYSGIVNVPPGGESTLVLHLTGSWPHGLAPYHLTMFHQPLLFPDRVKASGSFTSSSTGGP